MNATRQFKSMSLLILAQIMVGVNIVFSKVLLISMPILFILTIRFTLAAVVLLPLHWLTLDRKTPIKVHFKKLSRRDWRFIIAQALTAGIFFNVLMLLGLNHTDANVAGIITSALPALIAFLSWAVLREKMTVKKMICVIFATVGLTIIACDKFQGIASTHSFFGDSIVLLSLLPEAAYYILCKCHMSSLPIFLISSLLNGINALLMIIFLINSQTPNPSVPWSQMLILILLGLSSGLFYVFWAKGAEHVDGMLSSLSTAVMPVATVVLAWLILGEQLSIGQSLGMGMVIFSILLYARP